MKKLILFLGLFVGLFVTASAQNGGGNQDPAAMLQRYKDRVKPQLIEKAKISDAEADKVIEISFANRAKMRELRDLSEDDRKKKMTELQASQDKQFAAIPLTEAQVKAVDEFFEEQRKQMQQRQQNGGGN